LSQANEGQQKAIEAINKGENVFISGPAGVGKSWVAKETFNPNTVVVAPTGIAALNVQGSTCHKLFGLPLGIPTFDDYAKVPSKVYKLFGRDSKINRIDIDEIGMVRTDMLDLISHRLQKVKNNTLPFGGIQVVGYGDFYQLEPIVSGYDKQHFYQKYESAFCFSSKAWNLKTVELEQVMRQTDSRQIAMLNALRTGDRLAARALNSIVTEAKPYENSRDTLHLCCYKENAARINSHWYNMEKGESKTFRAQYYSVDKYNKPKWTEVPVDDIVELKIGCNVLIKANCPSRTYVNGNRGTVIGYTKDGVLVDLLNTDDTVKNNTVLVVPFTWEKYAYENYGGNLEKYVEASMTQMPLLLGYAATVHSCQGMTLDGVALDIGRGCFSAGQLYMALSRVRDLKNLSFVNPSIVTSKNIIVRKEVGEFYERERG
jgi:ATP-dependent DNA helicase PIF1